MSNVTTKSGADIIRILLAILLPPVGVLLQVGLEYPLDRRIVFGNQDGKLIQLPSLHIKHQRFFFFRRVFAHAVPESRFVLMPCPIHEPKQYLIAKSQYLNVLYF